MFIHLLMRKLIYIYLHISIMSTYLNKCLPTSLYVCKSILQIDSLQFTHSFCATAKKTSPESGGSSLEGPVTFYHII